MSEKNNGNILSPEEEKSLEEIKKMSMQEVNNILYASDAEEGIEDEAEYEEEFEEEEFEEEAADALQASVTEEEFEKENPDLYIAETSGGVKMVGRKIINYGGTSMDMKTAMKQKSIESAMLNKTWLSGIVIKSHWIRNTPDGLPDLIYTVRVTDGPCKGEVVSIIGAEMSKALIWDGTEEKRQRTLNLRKTWSKALIGAEIQFIITNIDISNSDNLYYDYLLVGSRLKVNKKMREQYFDINNEDRIKPGDIVNGKVLVVTANKVLFCVAGWDIYLSYRTPYITGTSVIYENENLKSLIEINEERECMVTNIFRYSSTKDIKKIHITFFEAMKDKIADIIKDLKPKDVLLGRVLRYSTPAGSDTAKYIIVKADIGIEVMCFMPNWKKPPMIGDVVKVKIVNVEPGDKKFLVVGSINR